MARAYQGQHGGSGLSLSIRQGQPPTASRWVRTLTQRQYAGTECPISLSLKAPMHAIRSLHPRVHSALGYIRSPERPEARDSGSVPGPDSHPYIPHRKHLGKQDKQHAGWSQQLGVGEGQAGWVSSSLVQLIPRPTLQFTPSEAPKKCVMDGL